jgi:peptidoglycan/xylan/chitin deacetylase (PgdA/CDA1 family)
MFYNCGTGKPRPKNMLAKSTLCALYKYSGISSVQERMQYWAGRQFVAILVFHRVTDAVPPDGLTVATAYFRAFCRKLEREFKVVSLAEIFRLVNQGEPLPPRTLAITFDDSYQECLSAAHILADHRLPACFFLPTSYIESQRPFDPEYPHLTNLNWGEVREIVRLGHEIGSHTVTHPNMTEVSGDEARHELTESKKVLEDRLGQPVRWFAYPFGGPEDFGAEQLPLVYEAGYEGVVSAYGGLVRRGMSRKILPRVPVPCFPNLVTLELHVTGCLDWWYGLRRWLHMLA